MISYDEALRLVREAAVPLASEIVPLSAGRVLAEDVVSAIDVPRFDNSAMDGFALVSGLPLMRRVRGKIVAGDAPSRAQLSAGDAVAIMTGAPLPLGADAVVKVEDVQRDGETIVLAKAVSAGAFVRKAGLDFHAGSVVARRGTRVTPELAMAIGAVGVGHISVVRRPRVTVIPTGRELVLPGDPLGSAGDIYSASSVYLQTALAADADVTVLPIVRDDPAEFVRVLASVRADVVITTGAVSMGDHDFIPQALGSDIVFHKMATRPAKPTLFARRGSLAIFGLAGNPISTAVGCRFLVWPFLARCLGLPDEAPRRMPAAVKQGELKCFYKCRIVDGRAVPTEGQDSHLIRPLTEADAWAVTTDRDGEADVYGIGIPR